MMIIKKRSWRPAETAPEGKQVLLARKGEQSMAVGHRLDDGPWGKAGFYIHPFGRVPDEVAPDLWHPAPEPLK